MSDGFRSPLQAWLGEQAGAPVEITELRRIATGNSREMWFFGLADGRRMIARV